MKSNKLHMNPQKLKKVKKGFRIYELVIFIVVAIVNLVPFLWGISTSLKPAREVLQYPPKAIGSSISFEHYSQVFHDTFPTGVKNSLIYCAVAIVIGLILALMAAYALTRFKFSGRRAFFILVLAGIPLSIGSAAMVVPNYTFFSSLHMTNRWYTLPLIYIAYNLPMAIWVLMSGMESVPKEIDEAATMDGAGKWYILFGVIVPVLLPSIASASLFIFLGAWNEFVVSSVMVSSGALQNIQVSIYNYMGFFGRQWGPLCAAATSAVLPTLIVFGFLGRLLISGLTAGSVKD